MLLLKNSNSKKPIINGSGFLNIPQFKLPTKTKIPSIIKKVVYGRNGYSPSVQKTLDIIGNALINGMSIGRTPVNSVMKYALTTLSNTNYDKIFHLFMILHTNIGSILIEKNESINIKQNARIPNGAEMINVPSVPHITINELLDNARNRMTPTKYYAYSGHDNNCQDFVLNVCNANNINSCNNFIKQDTKEIFDTHPNLRKFVNTITDLGSQIDTIAQGGQITKLQWKKTPT